MPAGDQIRVELRVAPRLTPNDAVAWPDDLAKDFRAILGDDDLDLGNKHG